MVSSGHDSAVQKSIVCKSSKDNIKQLHLTDMQLQQLATSVTDLHDDYCQYNFEMNYT